MDLVNVRSATLVLVNSHYSQETFYRTYGTFAKVSRLGIDTQEFRPVDVPTENLVLSVGALNPRKGFEFLIRALALINASDRPRLVVVSNYADRLEQRYLLNLAQQLRVEFTIEVGIKDDDLVSNYNRALLTAYSPIMEPFGFVPLESMACGIPVIGVKEAGVRETIIDGVTGILVERDTGSFARAILHLSQDFALRRKLGVQARSYVTEKWSWEMAIVDLEKHLASTAQHLAGQVQT